MPKDYHKYTTNSHPAPGQYHPPPGSKFPNRPSQCKLRDNNSGKYLKIHALWLVAQRHIL